MTRQTRRRNANECHVRQGIGLGKEQSDAWTRRAGVPSLMNDVFVSIGTRGGRRGIFNIRSGRSTWPTQRLRHASSASSACSSSLASTSMAFVGTESSKLSKLRGSILTRLLGVFKDNSSRVFAALHQRKVRRRVKEYNVCVGRTLLDGEILVGVTRKGSGETARGGVRSPDMVIEIQAENNKE